MLALTINRVTPKIMSRFKERNRYLSLQLNHQRRQRTLKEDETVLYSLEKKASYSGASRLSNFKEMLQRMQRVHGADLSQTSLIVLSHCIKNTNTLYLCFHLRLFGRASSFPGAGRHVTFLGTLMSDKSPTRSVSAQELCRDYEPRP